MAGQKGFVDSYLKEKNWDTVIKDVNQMRTALKIPQVRQIERVCLKCKKKFNTQHPGGQFVCCNKASDLDSFDF